MFILPVPFTLAGCEVPFIKGKTKMLIANKVPVKHH